MEQHERGERYTPGLPGEEEIHIPTPTIAPPTLGLGVLLVTFGIAGLSVRAPELLRAASSPLLVIGAIVILLGLAVWLINDAREFARGHGEHGGH